jgi:hypothetical protein
MTEPKLGRRQRCHCGSKKRYKDCCYAKDAAARQGRRSTTATLPTSSMGIPGEESGVCITFVTKDGEVGGPTGSPGNYNVVFFFRSPSAATDSSNFSMGVDEHNGSSLLAISRPALRLNDPRFDLSETHIEVSVSTVEGLQAKASGYPNKDGFLSDLRVTLTCESFADAQIKSHQLFIPLISALSFASDIPLIIGHTVLIEEATHVTQRTIIPPFPVAATSLHTSAHTPEARILFSRYRDGLNANDPNWRLLCFASIVEQLWKMSRANPPQALDLEAIVIPEEPRGLLSWFRSAFPSNYRMDDDLILGAVPLEARGVSTDEVIRKYIRPLRTAVAHSLIEDGKLPTEASEAKHLADVTRWLPLLRCITRHHLNATFRPANAK